MADAISAGLGDQPLARSISSWEEALTSPAPLCPEIQGGQEPHPCDQCLHCPVHLWQPLGSSSQDTEERGSAVVLETRLMWTLKAWAEWGASRSWAGRHGGRASGPHLAPGGDAGRWRLAQAHQGKYQKGGIGRQTPQKICQLALEKVSKPGGEYSGQSLAQQVRVGAWLGAPRA